MTAPTKYPWSIIKRLTLVDSCVYEKHDLKIKESAAKHNTGKIHILGCDQMTLKEQKQIMSQMRNHWTQIHCSVKNVLFMEVELSWTFQST